MCVLRLKVKMLKNVINICIDALAAAAVYILLFVVAEDIVE